MTRAVVGHVFGRYLPLSEVFSYELLRSLSAFDHHVFASRVENLDRFPWPHLHQPRSPEEWCSLIRRHGVALLVGHFGPLGTTAMPAALMSGIPAATIFHGYDVSMLLREPHWIERYRALAALGMHAVCISDAGRKRLLEIGWPAARVRTIHLGVDTTRLALVERRPVIDAVRLLMVARLVPKKGVDVAVRAVASLRSAGVRARLTVIGEGPERAALEGLVDALGLRESVTLVGARLHDEVLAELARTDVLWQCSVTAADGDQEGIPVALMEAQAHGVPVVATRHSGIPELVVHERTGLLVAEHDVEGLSRATARLARDPQLASRLAAAGRRRVGLRFDRSRQAAAFTRHFTTIIDRGIRRPRRRPPQPRREVLFVRSVPGEAALRKLMTLRFRYPDARLTVLTTASTARTFEACPIVDAVVTYADGRLTLRRLGRDLIARLQRFDFDLIAAAYPDEDGSGFGNVRRVLRALGGRRRIALTGRDAEVAVAGVPRPVLTGGQGCLERSA